MTSPAMRYRSFEVRAAADAPEGVVEGYITKFDVDYPIGWGLRERITAESFRGSIEERDGVLPIMYQHDHKNPPIGVATLTTDEQGVLARVQMFLEDARGAAVYRAMQAGALREWSVGFTTPNEGDVERDRDVEIIIRGDLLEASVVLRGANPDTETLSVRSEDGARAVPEESTESELPVEAEAPATRALPDALVSRLSEPWVRALLRDDLTANDTRDALSEELRETYPTGPDAYVWIVDWTSEYVIFEIYGTTYDDGMFQQSYTVTDGDVELTGERVEVTRKTVYVVDAD